jgi:hypothetical protein
MIYSQFDFFSKMKKVLESFADILVTSNIFTTNLKTTTYE